ncbi:uncharacterized protein LOC131178733 isoform X1 [Hevea brasiliensis]|uniref:uncharacterized protein LOC131178733 isoform X1 n=1 Tax=Hevea brasiliensis TaxID=3981 RepID=UPI0025D6BABB|nr:uncharacterized protein LOC131178733 isoform X1 [Hevea brasiliensis]
MNNLVIKRFLDASFFRSFSRPTASLTFLLYPRRNVVSVPSVEEDGETVNFPRDREDTGFSCGLNWALAGKGVIVKDKAFRNLKTSELRQKGATVAESLSGLPVLVRGNALGGASEISKPQFSKLLKHACFYPVTTHISSVSDIYVLDGAIASSSKCSAKVRIISDSPSAIFSLSNVLWKVPSRAISHDPCPLTVYVASSISQGVVDAVRLGAQANENVIAADIDCASLILCGKAFSDASATKEALATLSEPVISARGGIPLPARLLVSDDSVILLFAPEDIIQSCAYQLVSADSGVVLSSQDVAPYFPIKNSSGPSLFKFPIAVVLVTSDSSGTIPSISKLSPGQAAYHFLAGYHNGKFMPAYNKGPSSVDALELAKAFLSKLKDNQTTSFLINVNEGEKSVTGKVFLTLVQSALSKNIPSFHPKGGDLKGKYKSFLSCKFQEIPEELSF